MKITTVLIVEEIEKSLAFWVDRMGFQKTVDVPEGDRLGFVILVRDGAELMMQTLSSVRKDEPRFAPERLVTKGCGLFVEVSDFEDVKRRLDGYPVVMQERVTFYGMREIGVAEPNGHTVVFAAKTS
jgi:catechol 2,3-dioxygenase-like lactoylglutathione lyase family enzyme